MTGRSPFSPPATPFIHGEIEFWWTHTLERGNFILFSTKAWLKWEKVWLISGGFGRFIVQLYERRGVFFQYSSIDQDQENLGEVEAYKDSLWNWLESGLKKSNWKPSFAISRSRDNSWQKRIFLEAIEASARENSLKRILSLYYTRARSCLFLFLTILG